MGTIRKEGRRKNFAIIDNDFLNRKDLSWKAKGILAYLLSKPDDWEVYVTQLAKASSDGKAATATGFHELVAKGYIQKSKIRNAKGHFKGYKYDVHEDPTENRFSVIGKTEYRKPDYRKSDCRKSDTTNTNSTNTNSTKINSTKTKKKKKGEKGKSTPKTPPHSDYNFYLQKELKKREQRADQKEKVAPKRKRYIVPMLAAVYGKRFESEFGEPYEASESHKNAFRKIAEQIKRRLRKQNKPHDTQAITDFFAGMVVKMDSKFVQSKNFYPKFINSDLPNLVVSLGKNTAEATISQAYEGLGEDEDSMPW